MKILKTLGSACLGVIGLACTVAVIGTTSGYAIEKYDQANPRCINSLCEYPCKEGARFVKNQGCTKP